MRASATQGTVTISCIALSLLLLVGSIAVLRLAQDILRSTARIISVELADRDAFARLRRALQGGEAFQREVERLPLSPGVELRVARGAHGSVSRRIGAIFAHARPAIPRFNWSLALVQEDRCSRWDVTTRDPLSARRTHDLAIRSLRTCRALKPPSGQSAVIQGNLDLVEPFEISEQRDSTFRLTVLGELRLAELVLREVISSSIEVVSAGDVLLDKVVLDATRGGSLLVYSATGKITISQWGGECNLCTDESLYGVLRLRLEAPQSVKLGNRSVGRGCSVNRDPRFWLSLQFLGEAAV